MKIVYNIGNTGRHRGNMPAQLFHPSLPTVKERIVANSTIDNNGCWIWGLSTTTKNGKKGYARIAISENGKQRFRVAHKVAYEQFVGEVEDGLELDHLCCVTYCVNPEHLEPVTSVVNSRRSKAHQALWRRNREKTHCPKNHEYTEANTRAYVDKRGWKHRTCKNCESIRLAKSRQQKRLVLA